MDKWNTWNEPEMNEIYGKSRQRRHYMGAIAILMGMGICVFLIWFFKSLAGDGISEEYYELNQAESYTDMPG